MTKNNGTQVTLQPVPLKECKQKRQTEKKIISKPANDLTEIEMYVSFHKKKFSKSDEEPKIR